MSNEPIDEMELEEMPQEYDLDYDQARPNRFADLPGEHFRMVSLDPDVARYFSSSESVNKVLRAIIEAMPEAAQERV